MPSTNTHTDVVQICALLQCLGFSLKSLVPSVIGEGSVNQKGRTTVAISCQSSGLNVVMESPSTACSCPSPASQQNSRVWQVTGMTRGKMLDEEFGSSMLGYIPTSHRQRLTTCLLEILGSVKHHGNEVARSVSMSALRPQTPEKMQQREDLETPVRYRSLDTLTALAPKKCPEKKNVLAPKTQKPSRFAPGNVAIDEPSVFSMSNPPPTVRPKNKSSPFFGRKSSLLDSLISAQFALDVAIKKLKEEEKGPQFLEAAAGTEASLPRLDSSGGDTMPPPRNTSTANLETQTKKVSKFSRMVPKFFRKEQKDLDGKDLQPSISKTSTAPSALSLKSNPSFRDSFRFRSAIPRLVRNPSGNMNRDGKEKKLQIEKKK